MKEANATDVQAPTTLELVADCTVQVAVPDKVLYHAVQLATSSTYTCVARGGTCRQPLISDTFTLVQGKGQAQCLYSPHCYVVTKVMIAL